MQLRKTKAAAQAAHEQHIPDKDKTIKIKTKQTQESRTCTPETQEISRELTSRPEKGLASKSQNSSRIREGRIKKGVVIWPTAGKISRQADFRPNARKPSNRIKNSSRKGTRPNSPAGDNIEPQRDLKDKRKEEETNMLANENQEAVGHLGRQHKFPELNKRKETMQHDRKTERRLLFLITAGTVCQTTSPSWYSWSVAMLSLQAM